jgi:hypothetical protein
MNNAPINAIMEVTYQRPPGLSERYNPGEKNTRLAQNNARVNSHLSGQPNTFLTPSSLARWQDIYLWLIEEGGDSPGPLKHFERRPVYILGDYL